MDAIQAEMRWLRIFLGKKMLLDFANHAFITTKKIFCKLMPQTKIGDISLLDPTLSWEFPKVLFVKYKVVRWCTH
jgi:hypothetical protein